MSFKTVDQSLKLIIILSGIFFTFVTAQSVDSDKTERFCFPQTHRNTHKSCECNSESTSPWGTRSVRIDCSYKFFKMQDFDNDVLPLNTDRLDISWNALNLVPLFNGDSLRLLNLMHNNISAIRDKNFIGISHLRELYLRWNSIQIIEAKAFEGLASLQVLDLSHNNLKALPPNIFTPLVKLETLSMAWNRQLNQTEGIQEHDFYETFGIIPQLRSLQLDACNLGDIVLPKQAALMKLSLRRNRLTKMPRALPAKLEQLDLSDNLFPTLSSADTASYASIRELYLEDMPLLREVEQDAFVPLQSLEAVSFLNSRRLSNFHEYAFGQNVTPGESDEETNDGTSSRLTSIIFRGTSLHSFNISLAPVFRRLAVLDLKGVPLYCDCELIWVKQLPIETNGRCYKPSRLYGHLLTDTNVENFSCIEGWPGWLYGLIILILMSLFACGIYLAVMGLRPHRRVTMRRKVGAGSPYARVTIEPNNQENLK